MMKKIVIALVALLIMAGLVSCKPFHEADPGTTPLPSDDVTQSQTTGEAGITPLPSHDATPLKDRDIILEEKDFYYTNKNKQFTVYIGMDKQECLAAIGDRLPVAINGTDYEEVYEYTDEHISFWCDDQKVGGVYPRFDSEDIFMDWEICKGITVGTNRRDVEEKLGGPTDTDRVQLENGFVYYFYEFQKGKYRKIRDEQELEGVLQKSERDTIREIIIVFDEVGKVNDYSLGYAV